MPLHHDLTGADLHENKGVAAASDDTVATATTGATVWKKLTTANIDATSLKNMNKAQVSGTLPDMSTNNSVVFVPVPAACTLGVVSCATQAATTGSAASISVYNAATLLGTFTISAGSAGAASDHTVTGTFTAGSSIKVISAGGSTGACPLNLTLTLTLT